jgi:hypothetical protein
VEYYQWVEHSQTKREDKLGGKEVTTTTYTYTKEWVSSPIQSSHFHDPAYQNKNMVLTTFDDAEQYAENVSFGAYILPESLIHRISSREGMDLAISEDMLKHAALPGAAGLLAFRSLPRMTSCWKDLPVPVLSSWQLWRDSGDYQANLEGWRIYAQCCHRLAGGAHQVPGQARPASEIHHRSKSFPYDGLHHQYEVHQGTLHLSPRVRFRQHRHVLLHG